MEIRHFHWLKLIRSQNELDTVYVVFEGSHMPQGAGPPVIHMDV